jgi:O-antigen/teichoic acid export membrane protein
MPANLARSHPVRQFLASLSQRKTLLNLGALFSGSAVARVLSAFSIFILARQLGITQFGVYTAALSLAKLSSVLFSLGLDSWLLREGRRTPERFPAAVGTSLMLKLLLGILWLALLGLLAPMLNQESFPTPLVMVAAVSVLLEELAVTALTAFKAALRNKITFWLVMTAPAVLLLLNIFLSSCTVTTVAPYFMARILSFVLAGAMTLLLAWRLFGLSIRWGWMSEILRETRTFGISQGLALIYERADITIIAFVLGNTAAGVYAPAVSLMTTLYLIPLAIYEVMLPLVSTIHAQNRAQVRRTAFRFYLLSVSLGVGMGVGLTILAHPLVWILYGPEYAASGIILTVLSNVLIFKTISFALVAVIAAVGWQGRRAIVQAAAALLNVGLTFAVINRYGIQGVAHVYVLTEGLLTTGYVYLVVRWQQKNLAAPSTAA